jgi:hypothetical protein
LVQAQRPKDVADAASLRRMVWDGMSVAAMVRFPAIVVAEGIAESGWVRGFSGTAAEPQSVTVSYGHPWTAAEVQITTYPSDPVDDLAELVHSFAGGEWWAMTNRPPQPPAAPAGERRSPSTFTISKVDKPRPEVLAAQRTRARAIRAALKAAGKRDTAISIDGEATSAYLVEMPGLAAVGVRIDHPRELTVVLVARAADPESLELVSTTDLASRVGDRPAI